MSPQTVANTIPLFDNISNADLNALLTCLQSYEKYYKKGEIISIQEANDRYLGFVLSGSVRMLKADAWGNQTFLAYMEKGDIFGEGLAVQKIPSSYVTFVAAKDTQVLFLRASKIINTCPKNCPFHAQAIQNLFDLLGRKTVRLMEKIEITSKSSLREKIMAYLSMQVLRQNSRYIVSPLGRTELADFLGANRSALTRELNAMRADGLIDFDRNTFIIKRTSEE